MRAHLTAEAVQGATLPLEGVDDVHGGNGLALSVLGVGDSVTDNVFQENLENTTCLFVDEAGDTFDATATSETADGRLGDALDVVTKNFAMTLGATFSQTFASLAATSHDEFGVEM